MLFSLNSYKNLTFEINVTIAEMPYCREKWGCWGGEGQVREWVSVCDSHVRMPDRG